jgi:hypothetical protein
LHARISELETALESRADNADDADELPEAMAYDTPVTFRLRKDSTYTSQPHICSFDQMSIDNDTNARISRSKTNNSSDMPVPMLYSPSELPPTDIVKTGAKHFFVVISGLMHVMHQDEFDTMFEQVYNEDPIDVLDLGELCSLAAVGSQYCPEPVPDDIKDALCRTGSQHVNGLIDDNSLRAMRAIVCLAGYGMIEKRRSNRTLLSKLCRTQCTRVTNSSRHWTAGGAMERTRVQ